ncbi:MAG TPA: MFS transporter [Thermomicrobiales bacterium]|nr:MFS transporter [Thermomicrobiales bacterium]
MAATPVQTPAPAVGSDYPAAPPTPSPKRRRLRPTSAILGFPAALIILGITFSSVDIVTPVLPTVRDALGMNGTSAGLIISLFFLGRLIMSVPAGILVDRFGAPLVAAAGGLVMAIGSGISALASTDILLLASRVVQGAALAMLISAFMLSIVRARPGRGAALAIINVGAGLGTVAGLVASGVLTGLFSWNAVFVAVALLSLVIVVVALVTPRRRGLATHPANELDPEIIERVTVPTRDLVTPMGLNLIIQGGYGVFQVAFPLYAAWRFDASTGLIGSLLLVSTATHIACAVLTGRLINRHGASIVIPFGMLLGGIGLIGMLMMPSAVWLIPWLFPYAGGMVACNIAAQDHLLGVAGRGPRAVTLARFSTDLAQVLGPFLVGVLVDLSGYRTPFVVMAALLAAGMVVAARVALRDRSVVLTAQPAD